MAHTKLMGIINCTPDSFYDGGEFLNPDSAVEHALQLVREGADILDIGGESTRPGAESVTEQVELDRVLPVIHNIRKQSRIPISIDTTKPNVALQALDAGADLINDISGFCNPAMREVAASSGAKLCVMHMLGEPRTMQHDPRYKEGVLNTLRYFFEKQVELLLQEGVDEENIILDPGIGFGKTTEDNIEILHGLPLLKQFGFPILLGASRKSFMTRLLNKRAKDLLSATLTVNTIALLSGIDIIRVHDVREHRDAIDMVSHLTRYCATGWAPRGTLDK